MQKILFMFITLFYSTIINAVSDFDYQFKNDLSLSDILFIRSLHSHDKFLYALEEEGFNYKKLKDNEKKELLYLIRSRGIALNRNAFTYNKMYLENYQESIKKRYKSIQIMLEEQLAKSNSLANLETKDYLELFWYTSLNTGSAVSDVVGIGMYKKAMNAAKKLKTLGHIRSLRKIQNQYPRIKNFLNIIDSKAFITLQAILASGFTVSNKIANDINRDEALKRQLETWGIGFLGKLAGKKLSENQIGFISNLVASKTSEAVFALFTESIVSLTTKDNKSKLLSNVMDIFIDFVPVVGPFRAEWKIASEIAGRTTTSPKGIKAWNDYLEYEKKIQDEITKLIDKDLSKRVEALFEYAYGVNIKTFPDVDVRYWASTGILSMTEAGIIKGFTRGKWSGKFMPKEDVSIGQFLGMVTLIMFPNEKYGSDDKGYNFSKYKKFLQSKNINININGKFENSYLSKKATRGYIAKIITNIVFKNNQESTMISNVYIDDGTGNMVYMGGKFSNANNYTYNQIETCNERDDDWDECSSYLRALGITKAKNYRPNYNITRDEVSVMLYQLMKRKLNIADGNPTYLQILNYKKEH